MKRVLFILSLLTTSIIFSADLSLPQIKTSEDVVQVFPKNYDQMKAFKEDALFNAKEALVDLRKLVKENPDSYEVYEKYNQLINYLYSKASLSESLKLVAIESSFRDEASQSEIALKSFGNDLHSNETDLFMSIKNYNDQNQNLLTSVETYHLKQVIYEFESNGQGLSKSDRQYVQKLAKELQEIEHQFEKNIQEDNRAIFVSSSDLEGVNPRLINSLNQSEEGYFKLPCNMSVYLPTMTTCQSEKTRKEFLFAYNNRAAPTNEMVLKELIKKRDLIGKKLGYKNFAHFQLSNEMILSPENAASFLTNLSKKAQVKEKDEFELLSTNLPNNISLTPDGKIKAWDVGYVSTQYKQKNYSIDQDELAEYFPLEPTYRGLIGIYETFFDIKIEELPISGLWHEDVQLLKISEKDGTVLGFVVLDLFPRDNKYSHACCCPGAISGGTVENGQKLPTLNVVVANFPRATEDAPALLKHVEVQTFFHEFGHALHDIFSQSSIPYVGGIQRVKCDFVELPSQILEEWLWNPNILKFISSHYKTQKSLPDSMIQKLIQAKNFSSGSFIQTQNYYSFLALSLFSEGDNKNPSFISIDLKKQMLPFVECQPENNWFLAFGHLIEYGARYYGYMWSKVLALDIFEEIKKEGLLNPTVGKRYRKEVLSYGGHQDPNILIRNFLKREPSQDAFLQSMGLEK